MIKFNKEIKSKPRVRFCWECGRKLYGNHFAEHEFEGHKRIFHKTCWKLIEAGERVEEEDETDQM